MYQLTHNHKTEYLYKHIILIEKYNSKYVIDDWINGNYVNRIVMLTT